jgi:hypothetical protein
MLVPGVRALFFEPFNNVVQRGVVFKALASAVTEKHDRAPSQESISRAGFH